MQTELCKGRGVDGVRNVSTVTATTTDDFMFSMGAPSSDSKTLMSGVVANLMTFTY